LPEKNVAVIGGGLAGLAASVALGSAAYPVLLFEARTFLGGRATSYPLNAAEEDSPTIDNCQHVLLRCCTNLIDFYSRLGVRGRIRFYREFYWIEPNGRVSVMRRGALPAPLHFAGSFAKLKFLSLSDKLAIAAALLAIKYEYGKRTDLERITMLDWLREKKQTPRAIERFWRQVLVSAINEDLDRMAAVHGLQVFALGFLSRADAYEMGVPAVPLRDLYAEEAWREYPSVRIAHRAVVQQVRIEHGRVVGLVLNGSCVTADAYVVAVPFERLAALAPELPIDVSAFSHSPITGIHLWFDRVVTDLPHATLLDRTIQWMFNKHEGRHIQLVVSASRTLTEMPRAEVIDLALRELKEFFPRVSEAKLERAHVVKEVRATFSARPDLERSRPGSATSIPNLFLAGDWTRSGWPATMEGAVRSGYLAAEAVTRALGSPQRFLKPEMS
jgi:squalene-associated FAD-dependent desaturase